MNESSMRQWFGALAALAPAVGGALLLARLLATNRGVFPGGVFLMGILCGAVVLYVTKSRGWGSIVPAGIAAILGIALTFILNAKWNTAGHLADQLAEQHSIDRSIALQQAQTMLGGESLWSLMRSNWHSVWALAGLFAVLGTFLTIKSRLFGRLLRVPNVPEGGS
ncbi:hypothetical protein FJZ36_03180 [Candidatus Poribacteria bacterium]|nr:hypothetical protein [Candidatus Poribacteria bacterium]